MQQIYKSNLEIIYSWPSGQYDLDSVTTFLGQSVGFGFGNNSKPYIQFFGDNVSGGPEKTVIDLKNAYLDGLISGNLSIDCYADWFPATQAANPDKVSQPEFQIIYGSFTWSSAKTDAEARGGRLAVLNTLERANQVPAANVNVWIGATDEVSEGTWRWLDGSLLDSGYKNWDFGEPNDYQNPPNGIGEDYAYIVNYNNKWNDAINAANAYPYDVGGYVLELPKTGSGPATITWGYGGNSFSQTINPNVINHASGVSGTLVKTINIETGIVDVYPYVSPYSRNDVYEFEPIFNLNTGDLSITTTGYAIHRGKDVSFVFNVTDRQLNILNSTSALLENPFVRSVDIDILSIYGNTIYDNYVTGSFSNVFTLTEAENTRIFGTYTKDFGIGISTVGENANIHSSRYFVYGNPLEIQSISIADSSGAWLNNNPNQYQSYIPYSTSGNNMNAQNVTNNALYIKEYKDYVSGYFAEVSGLIPFAILNGESLKIDWGSGQIDTIFTQTGLSGFSSISGVSSFNTYTGDSLLKSLIYPSAINGQTYSFVTGYNYPTGMTGIYDVKFYYSGIGSTGNELIKTTQYRIPDELKSQGKPQIGDSATGQINFNIELENDPLYTNSDKLSLYISTGSGIELNTGNLISTIPILTNLKNYSFTLNNSVVKSNTPQWFKIVPFSETQTGYAWEIGPYNIYQAPTPKSNISSESFSLLNGDSEVNIDFLTGSVKTNSITTIDTLLKGSRYSYEYLTQFRDQSGCFCSSKIIIVDNTSGIDLLRTGLSFSEYSISDNSFANYSVSGDNQNIYLNVQLDTPTGTYKLYKTSI